MQSILNELGLGILKERFEAERVDPETVASLSDGNLASLGVSTIGERVRLRELCAKSLVKSKDENDAEPKNYRERVREERNRLFQSSRSSRGGRAGGRGRKGKSAYPQTQRQWSFHFVCLSDRLSFKTPSAVEKQMLYKAGLGSKKIKLDHDDDEDTVKEKITSDAKDSDGNHVAFPALRSCGGFELMQSAPNCRDLRRIDCCWSAKDLKGNLGGGQGKIYIVPIQKSLSTKPEQKTENSHLKEKCYICHKEILIRELRAHMWECTDEFKLSDEDDADLMESVFNTPRDEPDIVTPTTASSTLTQFVTTTTQPQPQHNHNSATGATAVVDLTNGNNANVPPTSSANDSVKYDEMTVDEVVEKTVHYCHTNDINNPVEILRCFQQDMVTGRALEVQYTHEAIGGETNFIMVDRQNLLETAFDEIGSLSDYRKTLEVQFYDEGAQDYGGPRKEFFRLALNEIKTKYFDNGLRELMREEYTTAGIILGLSIIQNGKIPTFVSEQMLQSIFSSDELGPCLKELRDGLKKVGIYQIGCELPMFLHLLRPGPTQALTVKNVTYLLKPQFSEEGSNNRTVENAVYAKFLKYLREAASGRRNKVNLTHILQFTTGAEEEPVLGFKLHPSLIFVPVSNTFLPTANTCINCLSLPRPSMDVPLPTEENLFDLYDLGFSNAFFGNL